MPPPFVSKPGMILEPDIFLLLICLKADSESRVNPDPELLGAPFPFAEGKGVPTWKERALSQLPKLIYV